MYSGVRGETMSQGRSALEFRVSDEEAANLKRACRSRERAASYIAH
jgi:hypothetical protein